jgi:hypothetical protein
VAQPAVGASLDELVAFAERGFVAPLLAQPMRGRPGKNNRWRGKNHGGDQFTGGLGEADRPHICPCQCEAKHDQEDAPSRCRRAGHFFLPGGLLAGFDEGKRPDDPAQQELDESGNLQHGLDCIVERLKMGNGCEGKSALTLGHLCKLGGERLQSGIEMAKTKEQIFEVACPDCGAMLRIDSTNGLVVSHTPAPRKRMFEDFETAAQAMRAQDERTESIFRQSVEAEKNKEDLFEKKFADALRKAKDAPEGKPLREFDLD